MHFRAHAQVCVSQQHPAAHGHRQHFAFKKSVSLMQVLIPVDSGAEVAEWVFERSPAELKSAVMAARRKREQSEVSQYMNKTTGFFYVGNLCHERAKLRGVC